MQHTGEDHQLGQGIHVRLKHGVVEDDGCVAIQSGHRDNNVYNRINDVKEKVPFLPFLWRPGLFFGRSALTENQRR